MYAGQWQKLGSLSVDSKDLSMKYYYREHLSGYARMKAEGKVTWGGISYHSGEDDMETFSSRPFLEDILHRLQFATSIPDVFELGTGTGPVACFLARRGFNVDAIDLIPGAIEVAKQLAHERSLGIHYEVMDICQIPSDGKQYDVIVDSYCLQGIVLEADRKKVFSAIHSRLKENGYYVISSSVGRKGLMNAQQVVDEVSGRTFLQDENKDIFDPGSGIFYKAFSWYQDLNDTPEDYADAIQVNGQWYAPNRKVHTSNSLKSELKHHGFDVLYQGGEEGEDLVCCLQGADVLFCDVS
jgi:2-polyprenyl-3-methyl-5-hydroxy-6-metoxy-1,4-benzoquinol methylase